jgi:aminoglycoside phosphotransferase (APT) family kinase protein
LHAQEVREVRSLTFGIASDVRLLEVDGQPMVLRRYLDDHLLERHPDVISDEADVLRAARQILGHVVPAPLALDPSGDRAGRPALLMTFLPGVPRMRDLDPNRLATPLVALHGGGAPEGLQLFRHWFEPSRVNVPSWSTRPEAWARLIDVALDGQPDHPPVFLHRDFHPGNLLWQGDDLSGIVDWATASLGPRGADIAHTRANLALVDGPDAAAGFLSAYVALVPSYQHDPWWDAAELCTWQNDFSGVLAFNAFGADLDAGLLQARADAYAAALLLA